MFRVRALATSLLIIALFTVSCGGDGSVVTDTEGGNPDFPKVIRMIESTTNFTEDDVKSIGWKAQKDFLLDYPGATTANPAEPLKLEIVFKRSMAAYSEKNSSVFCTT